VVSIRFERIANRAAKPTLVADGLGHIGDGGEHVILGRRAGRSGDAARRYQESGLDSSSTSPVVRSTDSGSSTGR
jgi:hypothetical protein